MTNSVRELSADDIVINLTTTPRKFQDVTELPANSPTDHMVEVDWNAESGWGTAEIKPYAPLAMDPASSVLHYATTCFEGLKAYRSKDGKSVRLFRPWDNMARLNDSMARVDLPEINQEAALEILKKYVEVEQRFVPAGGFLYLRPFAMATTASLGLRSATEAKLLIIASTLPSLSLKPLKLYCSQPGTIRAWPGGFGYAKLGANYGPTLQANKEAVSKGYHQVLWLDGEKGTVTEAGGSNFFAVLKNAETGRTEIVTCPLSTGVILPGVTRRSVLELLNNKFGGEVDVVEKEFTINDLEKASDESRLLEAFAVGTAYFVSPVEEILAPNGKSLAVPIGDEKSSGSFYGKYAGYTRDYLGGIMWGDDTTNKWYCGIKTYE